VATNQIAFRGRNDDGTETTATWKANQNNGWIQPVDTNFRVRFLVQNDTAQILNLDVQLQYSLNGAAFTNVTATSNVIRSSASANVTDAANLTAQLTGGTGTFIGATAFDEVNGICGGNSLDVTATGNFETEFCVQLRSADVINGDSIQLRTINSDTVAPWTTYTQIASLTAVGPSKFDAPTVTDAITIVFSPQLLTANLISYWELEEASGTRNDSHSTNHLTDNNTVTQVTGKVGNAAQFTAPNTEYLSIVDNASLSTEDIDFTIAAWVFLDSIADNRGIAGKIGPSGTAEWYLQYKTSPTNRFEFYVYTSDAGSSNFIQANTLGAVSTGQWYFIIAWHDTAVDKIFISVNNGAADENPRTITISDTASDFAIGIQQFTGGPYAPFYGRIDQVGFWKRILTASERTSLYNGGNGLSYAALVGAAGATVSVFDSPTVTDIQSITSVSSKSVADTPTLTDSHSINLVSAVANITISVSDIAMSGTFQSGIFQADAFQMESEGVTVVSVSSLSVADTPTVTDFINLFLTKLFTSVFDTPTVTDVPTLQLVTAVQNLTVNVGDQPTTTESTTIIGIASLSKFEFPAVTEFQALVSVSSLSIADSPIATDVPTVQLTSAAGLPVNVGDQPTATEQTVITAVTSLSVFDVPIATESRTITAASSLSAFDSPIVTDVRSGVSVSSLSVADTPTATDIPTVVLSGAAVLPVNIGDQPIVTEQLTVRSVGSLSVFDLPAATDATTVTAVASLSKFDAPTATDFRASVSVSSFSVADSPTASDIPILALIGAATLPVNLSDISTVTDATTIRAIASLSKFDQSIVIDASVMSAVSSLSAVDSPLATESLTTFFLGPLLISIADSPAVVESLDIGLTVLFPSIISLSGHAIADAALQGHSDDALSFSGKWANNMVISGQSPKDISLSGKSSSKLEIEGRTL
jgi:Concanavalin A-like lectin/glucanases superfamily